MPIAINPIKKDLVKRSIMQGKSFKQSLLDAGYAPNTAGHKVNPNNKLLKDVTKEIQDSFKASDITPDIVLGRLNKDYQLALDKGDLPTATRINELLGKYLALFTDKQQIDQHITTQEDRDILDRHRSRLGLS